MLSIAVRPIIGNRVLSMAARSRQWVRGRSLSSRDHWGALCCAIDFGNFGEFGKLLAIDGTAR